MQLMGCEIGEPMSVMHFRVIGCGHRGPSGLRVFPQIRHPQAVRSVGIGPRENALAQRNHITNLDSAESVLHRLAGTILVTVPPSPT